jgi:hypothetical protein
MTQAGHKQQGLEQLKPMTFIMNSDWAQYRKLIKKLKNDHLLGNDS